VSGEAFWAGEQASDAIPVFSGVLKKGRNLWEFKGKYHQVSDDELTPEDSRRCQPVCYRAQAQA
jgi:hypothetical protein